MELIIKSIFGSHLYGTNTENSDTDYKGIYLPSKKDCYLNNVKNTIQTKTNNDGKNSKDDIDEEIFSLQYFMKLAINGEMIVLDLLHTPDNLIIQSSDIWKELRNNRSKFYSKNMAGYLGYIRKQTLQYGIKGERLLVIEELLKFLNTHNQENKLLSVWNDLPINQYCKYVDNPKEKRWRHYECCGKMLQETMTIRYSKDIIEKLYNSYGERAQKAKLNEGVDWKAVSHAFRAGLQLKEILITNDLIYPLKDAKFITDIKTGKYHYLNDCIGEKLEQLLFDIEELVKNSSLPNEVDKQWLDDFILNVYK